MVVFIELGDPLSFPKKLILGLNLFILKPLPVNGLILLTNVNADFPILGTILTIVKTL